MRGTHLILRGLLTLGLCIAALPAMAATYGIKVASVYPASLEIYQLCDDAVPECNVALPGLMVRISFATGQAVLRFERNGHFFATAPGGARRLVYMPLPRKGEETAQVTLHNPAPATTLEITIDPLTPGDPVPVTTEFRPI